MAAVKETLVSSTALKTLERDSTRAVPVLVVGAGPTGLTAAIELARRGVAVRIVDKVVKRPDTESRALGMHARTQEIYARTGVLAPMLEEGSLLKRFNFYVNGKPLGAIGFDSLPSAHNYTLMLPQSRVEHHLLEHLASLGVTVERPLEVKSMVQNTDHVVATLQNETGLEQTLKASYVIAADGGRSTIRKLLGLDFEGQKMQGEFVMDAEVEFLDKRLPEGEGFFSLGSRTMLVFGKLGKTTPLWRMAVSMQQDDPRMKRETPTLEQVQELVDEHPFGIKLHRPTWASAYFISARMVDKTRLGRIFLAGDAAHIHSPVGGQGMNTGIQDATNLAWKLALVVSHQASDSLLESYHAERYPIMKRLLNTTSTMEHVLMTQNPVVAGLRNTAIATLTNVAALQSKLITRFTGYEVSYPESPMSGQAHSGLLGPRPGDAAPDAADLYFEGKTQRLFEHWGKDTRLQLLLFTGGQLQPKRWGELEHLIKELSQQFGSLVQARMVVPSTNNEGNKTHMVDTRGLLHKAYKIAKETLYILRPDGFVAYHQSPISLAEVKTYLEKTFQHETLTAEQINVQSHQYTAASTLRF
jgi:2-polyprenyl-6-methoxyphenol hydroxylase-like FAD-dependent oxidoreductase